MSVLTKAGSSRHKMDWGVRRSSPTCTRGQVIRGTTFMSGTRHSDTHVQYELDTATWLGPFEPRDTPFSMVKEAADLIVAAGLKAEALQDARPAQWSKLIFNASVNGVSALTGLPHSPHFGDESQFPTLGHLLHDLIEEGKRVAAAAGVHLHEDPWEMNKIGAMTNHPTVDAQRHSASLADRSRLSEWRDRAGSGARRSVSALHTAVYRLIEVRKHRGVSRTRTGRSQRMERGTSRCHGRSTN